MLAHCESPSSSSNTYVSRATNWLFTPEPCCVHSTARRAAWASVMWYEFTWTDVNSWSTVALGTWLGSLVVASMKSHPPSNPARRAAPTARPVHLVCFICFALPGLAVQGHAEDPRAGPRVVEVVQP